MFGPEIKILVVDDSESSVSQVTDVLAQLGFKNIIGASSAHIAFGKIQTKNPAVPGVDLVIADWQMPEVEGIDLLIEVRRRWPDLPFILMTSHTDLSKVSSAIEAKVSNFIVKPVVADVLRKKLEAVFRKHYSVG